MADGRHTAHGDRALNVKPFGLSTLLAAVLLPGACERAPPPATARLANPASVNCAKVGGRLVLEKNPQGAEFGVCYFEDNRQCEEWALLRGECAAGGRRVTGYATQAGRYCAITGGEYTDVSEDASGEHGNCILPGGRKCEAEAYYRGDCRRQ